MYVHSHKEDCSQDKLVVFVVISTCLFFVVVVGIVFYSGDLSDTDDLPVIALVSPIVFYHPNKHVTFFTLIPESNIFSLINNLPVVIRAPPL
jgi:hypothetical protein